MRRAIPRGVALAAFLAPASASAHGIGEDAAGRTVLEYIPFGSEHMLLGWDHLLFVFGVVLIAGTLVRAAKLLSLFVAGHSLTLIVASLAGWSVNVTAVDVVIALSVVFVGVVGIRGQPRDWRWFGAAVFGFGLVHGLGLATRLQDAGLPDDGILLKVLAFNVGVEVGQMLAVGAVVALGYALSHGSTKPIAEIRRTAFVLVAVGGLIGVAVLSLPGPEDEGDSRLIAAGCEESGPPSLPFDPAASHPERAFYEPGDAVDETNLNHVVGDGFLIVRYSDELTPKQVGQLRRWHESAPQFAIAAPDEDQEEAIRTLTREGTLTCGELDVDALAEYSDSWFSRIDEA